MNNEPIVAAAQIAGLMYHEVTNDYRSTGFQRPAARQCTLSPHQFNQHMQEIRTGPLIPRIVHDIEPAKPGRYLLLTFDDGGRSALLAAEMLARDGWKGHFFIVTSRLGERTFLDKKAVRELHEGGHVVGSHSHTHPDIFWDLSRPNMLSEWKRSTGIISDITGAPCTTASVPGGDMSRETIETASEAGIRHLFSSEPWLQPRMICGCWVLGRFFVRSHVTSDMVRNLIQMQGWRKAQLERWLKHVARRGMGPLYGMYVRRVTRTDTEPVKTG